MLTTKQRKNIVRKAKALIKDEIPDYDSLGGKQEAILDTYIEKLCKERGYELIHFYNEEGKVLEKILNI